MRLFHGLAACLATVAIAVSGCTVVGSQATPVNNDLESIRHCNRPVGKGVLLTFDDHGSAWQIQAILDKLREHQMRAAFFPTGKWAEQHLDLIGQIKAAGHIVGNHTYSHANLAELSAHDEAAFYGEIYPLRGVPNTDPMLLRLPFGEGENDPLVIEPTAIVNIRIPSVNIDAGMSGETWPRESPRCHGAPTCIDPPELKMAAWYGAYALPSYPSEDSVLIFGHSNWKNPDQQVFNNLPAVKAGDAVIVTTENAEFMYRANDPVLENYETIHLSELVYGHVPNRIVLVTCNDKEQAATVVTADLVEAKPL